VKAVSTTVIDMSGTRAEVPTTTSIRYPGSFRIEASTPEGPLVQVFASGTFWVEDARGSREAPPQVAAQMRAIVQRDSLPLLLALADGRLTATRTDVMEAGHSLPGLNVTSAGMRGLTVILDPVTSLILKQRYMAADGEGLAEEAFSDYRDVNGLQVAFRAVLRRPGAPTIERRLQTFEYNLSLPPALFTKPS
jgi:hypothetical protein